MKEELFLFVFLSVFITLIDLGTQIQGTQTRYTVVNFGLNQPLIRDLQVYSLAILGIYIKMTEDLSGFKIIAFGGTIDLGKQKRQRGMLVLLLSIVA